MANAEELILHAMSSEVTIIMSARVGGDRRLSAKLRRGIENALAFMDAHIDGVRAALPAERRLSFCETSLFCLVTHLPFRDVMDVGRYRNLDAFCREFVQRTGARDTTYRFGQPAPEQPDRS